MRTVADGVDVTVEPPQIGTREITIVLRIIVDDPAASAAPTTSHTTLPLYFPADVNASTDVEHHQRRTPRNLLLGAGAATFAALAAVTMMTTSPRPAPVAERPLLETEQAPTSAQTNEAVLSSLEPTARRYVEGIMAMTPAHLAATFGNGLIGANDATGAIGRYPVAGCREPNPDIG